MLQFFERLFEIDSSTSIGADGEWKDTHDDWSDGWKRSAWTHISRL